MKGERVGHRRWHPTLLLLLLAPAAAPADASESGYTYRLAESDGVPVTVSVDEGGFVWPALPAAADTAFLELEIVRARGGEPSLQLRHGDVELHQVIERGAQGARFLDVGPLLRRPPSAGERVAIIGDQVRWSSGETALVWFQNQPVADRRVLVVAPHPDDAEIAAFGLYREGRSDVVTVTAGDAGGQGLEALFPEAGEHYRIKGWIRTWDSLVVPFFGGVPADRTRNLGYYDATLERMYRLRPQVVTPPLATLEDPAFYRRFNVDPGLAQRAFSATWESLVADLLGELERVQPAVVVAPHPLLDRHTDHQYTAIALIEALDRWPAECELYLYTNHAVEAEEYPFGPREAMTGLPPWHGGELFFRRLYSHPLDEHARRLKLVALEAMHDLRPFDLRQETRRKIDRKQRKEGLRYDYFRRAPRPNELFFVLDREAARRLRRAFLAEP